MKKLILAVLLSITATSAIAQHGYRGGHGGYRGGHNNYSYNGGGGYRGGWVAPAVGGLIVGGLVGAALAYPYNAPAPVYSQPAPVYVDPAVPYGYHYQTMVDPNCNCYVTVLVPN